MNQTPQQTPKSNAVAIALYLNAAILVAILVALLGHDRLGTPAAYGDMGVPQQMPIAGGNGIYVMPCQLHPSVWGCEVLDTNRQTLCIYDYRADKQSLELTASRFVGYDTQLKDFNTTPSWHEVQKLVEAPEAVGNLTDAPAAPK
jgi:hypothetical protein